MSTATITAQTACTYICICVLTWAPLKAQRDRREAVTTLALFASRIINLRTNDRGLSRNSRFAMRFRVSVKAYYIIYIYVHVYIHVLEIEVALQLHIEDWIYRGRWSWWISEMVCFRFLIDCAISISVSNTRYNICRYYLCRYHLLLIEKRSV